MPPSEAPTATGRTPLRSASVSASTRASAAKSAKAVGAVRDPFGIAVAALIDRIGDAAQRAIRSPVLRQAWRVWPPPCSSSTGGPSSP